MITPEIRQRYEKVKTLAQRGATEGERAAAEEARQRMEERYPGLVTPQPDDEPVLRWVTDDASSSSGATTANDTGAVYVWSFHIRF